LSKKPRMQNATAPNPAPPTATGRGGDVAASALLQNYRPLPGIHDEMMLPSGELRAPWRVFGDLLAQCNAQDIQARHKTAQHLLHDHGVTYNIFDDAIGTSRPWSLDLIPHIVAATEAEQVAQGIDQRARLLDTILRDLYGPQRIIKEGWLPSALVHANPGFLRPLAGLAPPGGRFLHVTGCDLVRTEDGAWRVLADRTQVPGGQGYALENRIILSNVFPEEFNASRVQRLAAYFDVERETFRSLAPGRRAAPTIVMLTPGPRDETYFEHAFKARYLGFPLVMGADLTVRDRRVHLKTLEGLRRVDVVLRRLDDVQCDPLEMHADASQGIPGLIEAWRSGGVALCNGLGTGLVETPALHPFLPGLCRHLLGEQLRLPCVPTWWCGQQKQLNMVLSDPQKWVLKEAFVRGARDPIFLGKIDENARKAALDRLKAAPHRWVAQEMLRLSTTPTWTGDRLEPRSLVWRTFGLHHGGSYTMMPGGLSRVSPHADGRVVTMRSGGISKDTWVLSDGPIPVRPPSQSQPIIIHPARPPSAVPSRVADHLFWLGRYAERLEQTIRLLRTMLQRVSGEVTESQTRELQSCLTLMEEAHLLPVGLPPAEIRPTIHALINDPKSENGVRQLVSSVRYNAAAARDRLSDDTWRLFNKIESDAAPTPPPLKVSQALIGLDTLILDLAAFSGMQIENMTHGHGWRFLEIGRRLERAIFTTPLIKAAAIAAGKQDESVLSPLLEICDSTMTYRRLHFARPQLVQTAYLLFQDPSNPRSVAYQVERLVERLSELPVDPHRGSETSQVSRMEEILALVRSPNLPAWAAAQHLAVEALPPLCTTVVEKLESLSGTLTENYFSHAVRKVR